MKKIYSVTMILFTLWVSSVKAQPNACPGATAITVVGATSCYVLIQGAIPNGQIAVYSSTGVISILPATFTNSVGFGFAFYTCGQTPTAVTVVSGTTVCFPTVSTPIGLPIKVKNFTAQPQGDNSVMLRWMSVFEADSYKYVVQRSTDGRNFSDVSEIKAAGNSLTALNYFYADRQGANGGVYYRLKLVDIDGSFDYTKILYINNGQVMFGQLSVFPNPFRSEVQLKGVTASDVNRKNVKLYNSMGSEIAYRVLSGNSIVIDPALPKGIYILKVKGQAYKLFKE